MLACSAHAALVSNPPPAKKTLVGVDGFSGFRQGVRPQLAKVMQRFEDKGLALKMIFYRGQKVWTEGCPETFCVDHWRCRYLAAGEGTDQQAILALLGAVMGAGRDFIKIENHDTYDGEPGFWLGQGE